MSKKSVKTLLITLYSFKVLNAEALLYQKVFFLECIGRGRVGQIMMKADEGGGGLGHG